MIGLPTTHSHEQATQDIDKLKKEILAYIEQTYKKKYVGDLNVNIIKPYGYQVTFGLNVPEKPLVISAQLDYCSFLKFIKQEIHDRRMDMVKYFIGVMNLPYQCQTDTSCACRKTN